MNGRNAVINGSTASLIGRRPRTHEPRMGIRMRVGPRTRMGMRVKDERVRMRMRVKGEREEQDEGHKEEGQG